LELEPAVVLPDDHMPPWTDRVDGSIYVRAITAAAKKQEIN
jgi:hypothetical protein